MFIPLFPSPFSSLERPRTALASDVFYIIFSDFLWFIPFLEYRPSSENLGKSGLGLQQNRLINRCIQVTKGLIHQIILRFYFLFGTLMESVHEVFQNTCPHIKNKSKLMINKSKLIINLAKW